MSETEPKPDSASTLTEAIELRYLDPKKLRFFRHGATLRLMLEDECSYLQVTVFRMFPLSEPQRYLSARDGANKEIGVIVNPRELDAESQRLVAEELERRYLVPIIQRIVAVKERFGTVDWEVETNRGVCRFTTRNLRENVSQPSPKRYILSDVDGNRYDVRDLTALDATSQAWLMKYL
jgi:hypothetical protein